MIHFCYLSHPNSGALLQLLLSHFSCVGLCATPYMAAHQAPPSLGFSRQEYWSGLPFPSPTHKVKSESEVGQSCPTLSDLMDCSLPGSSIPATSSINTSGDTREPERPLGLKEFSWEQWKEQSALESNQPGMEPWLCITHCVTLGKTLHLSVPWFLICKTGIVISFFLKRMFLGLNVKTYSLWLLLIQVTHDRLATRHGHQCKLWPFNNTDVMDMTHFSKITTKCKTVWGYHTFHGVLWTSWRLYPFSVLLAAVNLSHICSFSLCPPGNFSFSFFPSAVLGLCCGTQGSRTRRLSGRSTWVYSPRSV